MYLVLSKLILPKISNNLESRKSQILYNIEAAEKQRKDSVSKLKEYDEIISKSKLEAKNIFKETREKVLKDINSKRESLDNEIDDEIKKAEDEISLLKKNAHLKSYWASAKKNWLSFYGINKDHLQPRFKITL